MTISILSQFLLMSILIQDRDPNESVATVHTSSAYTYRAAHSVDPRQYYINENRSVRFS